MLLWQTTALISLVGEVFQHCDSRCESSDRPIPSQDSICSQRWLLWSLCIQVGCLQLLLLGSLLCFHWWAVAWHPSLFFAQSRGRAAPCCFPRALQAVSHLAVLAACPCRLRVAGNAAVSVQAMGETEGQLRASLPGKEAFFLLLPLSLVYPHVYLHPWLQRWCLSVAAH